MDFKHSDCASVTFAFMILTTTAMGLPKRKYLAFLFIWKLSVLTCPPPLSLSLIFYSILGCFRCCLPLHEVAIHQSPPTFSVLCCPCPDCSLLPYNVIFPMTFWSSNWSYTLYLPLCTFNSPSIIFPLADVSSLFPFCIGYLLDYVGYSGSLPNDGVMDSVF